MKFKKKTRLFLNENKNVKKETVWTWESAASKLSICMKFQGHSKLNKYKIIS